MTPFRKGDLVRVTGGLAVDRVGYAITGRTVERDHEAALYDAAKQALASMGLVGVTPTRRLLAELAHNVAAAQRFGGPERSVYYVPYDFGDKVYRVVDKRTRRTGTRTPGFQSYWDPSDSEPPHLTAAKTHVQCGLIEDGLCLYDPEDLLWVDAGDLVRVEP